MSLKPKVKRTVDQMILGAERIDVTESAMLRMVDNKSNLILYEELMDERKYPDIDAVLGPHKCCIFLYQVHRFDGHWACLFTDDKDPNKLLFFDSYGIRLDDELPFSKHNRRNHKGVITPHLTALIDKSKYIVSSNTYQFQQDGRKNNECGSHTACRIVFRHLSHKQYQTFMTKNKHYDPDFWAVALTLLFR